MKKINLILVIFHLTLCSFSQEKQKINYQIVYHIESTRNGVSEVDDSCVLSISDDYSFFYSLGYLAWMEKVRNHLGIHTIETATEQLDLSKQAGTCMKCTRTVFYKRYKEKSCYFVESFAGNTYAYNNPKFSRLNWVITSDTTNIINYKCTKAVLKLDSITVTAWFCKDIPISDGPSVLNGLPGLILRSESTSGLKTEIMRIERNKESEKINWYLDKKILFTSLNEFLQMRNYYYEELNSGRKVDFGNGVQIQKN